MMGQSIWMQKIDSTGADMQLIIPQLANLSLIADTPHP